MFGAVGNVMIQLFEVSRGGGEYFIKKTRRKEERWRGVGGALVREVSSRSLATDTLVGGHNYS